MDLIETIKSRKSIRAYKPIPVPQEILRELMEVSLCAPSFANTQPWEFTVVGGKVLDQLREAMVDKAASGARPNFEIPWPSFPELYRNRSRELGFSLYAALGIAREDREGRKEWELQGLRFFNAPNAIIFYIDKALNAWSILDLGLLMQTVMLAAQHCGLGTCLQAAVVGYPEIIRKVLNIPESKLIVVGMSIGYPDWEHKATKFRSNREPLEKFATWMGI